MTSNVFIKYVTAHHQRACIWSVLLYIVVVVYRMEINIFLIEQSSYRGSPSTLCVIVFSFFFFFFFFLKEFSVLSQRLMST